MPVSLILNSIACRLRKWPPPATVTFPFSVNLIALFIRF